MKSRSLFNLVTDASDVLGFFEDVETPEQMISALERIKRREGEEFLVCIASLRLSLTGLLDDTLEMSGGPDEDDERDELGDIGDELDGLDETTGETPVGESPEKNENQPAKAAADGGKTG